MDYNYRNVQTIFFLLILTPTELISLLLWELYVCVSECIGLKVLQKYYKGTKICSKKKKNEIKTPTMTLRGFCAFLLGITTNKYLSLRLQYI